MAHLSVNNNLIFTGCYAINDTLAPKGAIVRTAVIILGHGSRSTGSEAAVKAVVAEMRKAHALVEHAFLQYVPPTPHEALERCIAQKADRIVIVPFFLQAGAHVTKDIPELVEQARKAHPGVEIVVTEYVGAHPLMAKVVEELVKQQGAHM
jgi:sirohydrochlorin ferrochelatase